MASSLKYTLHQYGTESDLQRVGVWDVDIADKSKYWIIYIHGGAWRDPRVTLETFRPSIDEILPPDPAPGVPAGPGPGRFRRRPATRTTSTTRAPRSPSCRRATASAPTTSSSATRPAAPVACAGRFGEERWRGDRLVLAWSRDDELVDEPEVDAMARRLRRDGARGLVVDKDVLRGAHDEIWRSGAGAAQLVEMVLVELGAGGR